MFENWNRFLETELKRKAERDRQKGDRDGRKSKGSKKRIQAVVEPAAPGQGKTVSGELLEP